MTIANPLVSGLPTDYYAPNYRIEVEGREIDPESMGDVLDIKVTMDKENLTSFEFNVNNWDDKTLAFKYSDTQTFDVGNRVHVSMGYADRMQFMASGMITAMTPHFPESGPPTLAITGVDNLVKLRDRKPQDGEIKQFINLADWEIAAIVAERNHLAFHADQIGEKRALVIQKNQDDAVFLTERAKRIDFDVYISIDPDTGKDTLYFVQPPQANDSTVERVYRFEWGKSLINFNPVLSVRNQVSKVTVRGWDSATKQRFSYTAGPDDLPRGNSGGTTGPEVAAQKFGDKQDLVVDQPVTSAQEARDLALSLLRERAYGYLTGSGRVIGLPDLRPGNTVQLLGLGKRFSGEYEVRKVVHSIGSSGYITEFEVRSPSDGGSS